MPDPLTNQLRDRLDALHIEHKDHDTEHQAMTSWTVQPQGGAPYTLLYINGLDDHRPTLQLRCGPHEALAITELLSKGITTTLEETPYNTTWPHDLRCTSCGAVRPYFFWYDNTGECRRLIQRRCPACDRRIVEPNS